MFRKVLQPLYTLYVVLTFLISLIIVFPLVALVSTGNSIKARRGIYGILKTWSTIWLALIGMPLVKRGVRPAKGRYIVVANHISYMDTIVIFPAMPGYFRVLGKKEFARIPVVGFIYKQLVILVDRSNNVSRAISMRLMWRVLRREGSIMIFPEGTFNETDAPLKSFYDGAFRLALTTGADILPIVFPDTLHRWHYSHWWKMWPGRNRVVYLPPVPVAGMTLEQLPELKTRVYGLMEAELQKYRQPRQ